MTPDNAGAARERKLRSEIEWCRDINARMLTEISDIEGGLTKAQRTPKLQRKLTELRERIETAHGCALDALAALAALQHKEPSRDS